MVLPIMQFDRYERKGRAGLISDSSLLDTVTGVSDEAVRHGVIVDITGIAGNDDNKSTLKFATLATGAAGKAAKRPAIVALSHYDTVEGRNNGVAAGAPANLVETGRVWVLLKTGVTVTPMGPVAVAAPSAGSNVVSGVKGTVTNAAGDGSDAVRGLVFTGRTDKNSAGVEIAEVQIRPQTA